MKKIYALYIFSVLAILFLFSANQTFAANCSPLYNGGVTNQQYCINPTPTPQSQNQNQNSNQTSVPQQTNGGQKIYPAARSKTTPNTGPEDWSLPALFLIGGMGFWLRNKAKV